MLIIWLVLLLEALTVGPLDPIGSLLIKLKNILIKLENAQTVVTLDILKMGVPRKVIRLKRKNLITQNMIPLNLKPLIRKPLTQKLLTLIIIVLRRKAKVIVKKNVIQNLTIKSHK